MAVSARKWSDSDGNAEKDDTLGGTPFVVTLYPVHPSLACIPERATDGKPTFAHDPCEGLPGPFASFTSSTGQGCPPEPRPPRYYTGVTSGVVKRIAIHNAGASIHTAKHPCRKRIEGSAVECDGH